MRLSVKAQKVIGVILAVLGLLCSISALFLINSIVLLTIALIAVNVAMILLRMDALRSKDTVPTIEAAIAVLLIVCGLAWLIPQSYGLYCTFMIAEMLFSAYLLVKEIVAKVKAPTERKWAKRIWLTAVSLCLVLCLAIGVYLSAIAIDPMVLIGQLQKNVNAVNSYEPAHTPAQTTLDSGAIYLNDLEYESDLPNSFFDVYLSPVAGENAPTYFYIHGGGYTSGDKVGGDPNTKDSGLEWYFGEFLANGYNVVTPNYAFVPEYLYPSAILQVNECVKYCMEHGSEFGISMDQVFFGGGSAGGNIAGMLALAYTNPAVADNLGMEAYLPADRVKACIFCSALINNEEYQVAHSPVIDYLFFVAGRVAFDTDFIRGNEIAEKTNIIKYADSNYCPCFISDGNNASFYSQAEALHERLNELGVENVLSLYPRSVELLPHGFESSQGSPCAQDNMEKVLAFLKEVLD